MPRIRRACRCASTSARPADPVEPCAAPCAWPGALRLGIDLAVDEDVLALQARVDALRADGWNVVERDPGLARGACVSTRCSRCSRPGCTRSTAIGSPMRAT
jgi:hypothetical protein